MKRHNRNLLVMIGIVALFMSLGIYGWSRFGSIPPTTTSRVESVQIIWTGSGGSCDVKTIDGHVDHIADALCGSLRSGDNYTYTTNPMAGTIAFLSAILTTRKSVV